MAKPIPQLLFLQILLLANIFKPSYTNVIVCPEMEKEALLSFKQSLEDPSNLLFSWNRSNSNCCTWKGVVCSNITGKVHQLRLRGDDDWYSNTGLLGKIDPSLLQLKHLKYLDLSRNNFDQRIPSFMGSLTSLEYLDLSNAGFYGKVPPTIGNLSRLHTLNLEASYYYGVLEVDRVEWLRGLSQLEHLNMNNVNLTKTGGHWMQVINALPFLVELHLSACGLNFNFDPLISEVNITSLEILDLQDNANYDESFPIPNWIFRQSNLVFLDLSWNNFQGPIPTITNLTKLQHIVLSGNPDLNSTIPDWLYSCKDLHFLSLNYISLQGSISNTAIGNLTSLTTLDLSDNHLSGGIPSGILNLYKLQILDLSNNMLQGEIPRGIVNLCTLETLDLSNNMLQGEIPDMLVRMSDCFLRDLRLSDNRLTGNLPMSEGQLSNLEVLDIGNNNMSGVVTECHFAGLTKLTSFFASGNHLTLKLSSNWTPPFKLKYLQLSSWNLGAGSDIPSWLETQKSTLDELDLSNTGISGNVPAWFWHMGFLNLSHNNLSGNIPAHINGIGGIHLNSNQFSGPLPRSGNYMFEINLSNNSFSGGISHFLCAPPNKSSTIPNYELKILNLGGNRLTGEIPKCWMKFPFLLVLNLGDNNFSGSIPSSIGLLTGLFSLNLRNNNLSGKIPISISSCTDLVTMELSGNKLVGNIPTEIGTSLRILILRSNRLRGTIPLSICHLNSLQIFDLSNNAFSGNIPSCLNNLTAMTVRRNSTEKIDVLLYQYTDAQEKYLESASVVTKGKKFQYNTILWLVNNIDLSGNNLSGGIPEELTSLVELKSLNLSGNHLTGSIPGSIGDLKQLESLDLSRNALSGEMPNSFSAMSFLSYLNLSCNNLRGRIPRNTQFDGMDNSSFLGNNLCGPPLTTKCPGDDSEDAGTKEDKYEDDDEIEWFYVVLSLGYALGLSVFCTTLVFKKPRRAYFQFLGCMWDKIYVYYHITCTKLISRAGTF